RLPTSRVTAGGEEPGDGEDVGQLVRRAQRPEGDVPEVALAGLPWAHVGVRVRVAGVAGGDPVVDLVNGEAEVEVFGPQHRLEVRGERPQRRVTEAEPVADHLGSG